jgi:hypothetical protein
MRTLAPALVLLALGAVAAERAAGLESPEAKGRNAAALSLLETAKQDLSAGRAEQAAVKIERALRIDPQNPTLWHYLGLARRELGDTTQAEVMAAKSRSLTAPEPAPERTFRQVAGEVWSSARSFGGWYDDRPETARPETARPETPRPATPRDECRVIAGNRAWTVACDDVERYFSSSGNSSTVRSSRAAAALERYYRRNGTNRGGRQR